jgi:GNAT superfamily N-acetyltransferase
LHRASLSPKDEPRGYPSELECVLAVADRRKVYVRPIVPADKDALREAVTHADPETLRARFLGGRPPADDRALDYLTVLDYVHRLALVAFDPKGRGVAIARYEGAAGSDVAEVAVAVDPAWRRVRLATGLLQLLASAAIERGITAFTASYYADNVDVHDLVTRSGLPHRQAAAGAVVVDIIELDKRRTADTDET